MAIITRPELFRDIRPDLKERLRDALTKRDYHADLAKAFDSDVEVLSRMLERENIRYAPSVTQETPQRQPQEALPEFIERTIQLRPMTKADLREYVTRAGYDVDGRSIHAVTVNLTRGGRIVEVADDVFAHVESDAAKRMEAKN